MSVKSGPIHHAASLEFGNRERTTTSSSALSNSSTAPLLPAPAVTNFYFGHVRRRLPLFLSLSLACLALLALLQRHTGGDLVTLEIFGASKQTVVPLGESVIPEPRPLTELGFEADYVYENVGSIKLSDYLEDLEDFLRRAFPSSDNDENDPASLVSLLHTFVPPIPRAIVVHPQKAFQHLVLLPWRWTYSKVSALWQRPEVPTPLPDLTIPKKIFQTGPYPGRSPPDDKILPITWQKGNPTHEYAYFDNEAALDFIEKRFNESRVKHGKGGGIAQTYKSMKNVPVMQSDFWRYAVLASEGGVYSDIDTKCLKAVDGWHRPPWQRQLGVFDDEPRPKPAIIVGIEVDVGSRPDWHAWWPRPLGLVQWTIASTKGHPILIDTMRRVSEAVAPSNVSEALKSGQHRVLDSVVEKTGPAPFTDSVLRYLGVKYNATWPELRQVPNEGILFGDEKIPGDVLVLSVTAFSPGVGQFGSQDTSSEAALVHHLFAGSWKGSQ